MMAKAQAFLDSWLAKLTSRKLMVWLTATGLTREMYTRSFLTLFRRGHFNSLIGLCSQSK